MSQVDRAKLTEKITEANELITKTYTELGTVTAEYDAATATRKGLVKRHKELLEARATNQTVPGMETNAALLMEIGKVAQQLELVTLRRKELNKVRKHIVETLNELQSGAAHLQRMLGAPCDDSA